MRRFARSVKHALRGVYHASKMEKNFRLEIIAAILVAILAYLLPVTAQERVLLVFVVAGVLVIELINTAIERVVDMLKPRVHPYARIAKDVMAAAVLIASIGAMMIGLGIFLPYILKIFS
ncbi:MAG: diacylglycerol kinase family protein [Candidatus Moranbacteria bacterium]|nr:diacylglycerol kinase family protein [Candidatus Moranbacteria bacterium]